MSRKIVIHPDYEHLRPFVEQLPIDFPTHGKVLQDRRNTIKTFEVNGTIINVKRFRIPIFINRIVYSFFRGSKASKAYYNSLEVIKRGFDTPHSIAYIEEYACGLLAYSYYISLQSPLSKEIRIFYSGPLEGNESFFKAFAHYSAALHEAGIYHQDYSPGNILFEEKEGKYDFCLVDINRMQFRSVTLESGCRNFERLFDNDDVYRFLALQYAEARKMDAGECIRLIFLYKNHFLRKDLRKERWKRLLS